MASQSDHNPEVLDSKIKSLFCSTNLPAFATPKTKQNCPSAAAIARSLPFLGIGALEHQHRSTQCLRLTPKSKRKYETNVKICSNPSPRLENLTAQL